MKHFFALLIVFAAFGAQSQWNLHQVIVLNEGPWGGPVTVGSYNPETGTYQNFATIEARFASDLLLEDTKLYVAADSLLLAYDLDSKALLGSIVVPGIRELAIWNNQLLVSRAEVAPLPSYFQVYNKYTLQLLYELPQLSERAAEMVVWENKAYVAINGFGSVGRVAVVDLAAQQLLEEIDLGPGGLNPENFEMDTATGRFYLVNNLDWSDASVTEFNPDNQSFTHTLLNRPSGCSASAYFSEKVYFQTLGDDKLGVYSTASQTVSDELNVNAYIYGLAIDKVNQHIYSSETDFVNWGQVSIHDLEGSFIHSFACGVSPGTIAFDYRLAGHTETSAQIQINAYPNPASNRLLVDMPAACAECVYSLSDATGKKFWSGTLKSVPAQIEIQPHWPRGLCLLECVRDGYISRQKVVIE